MSATSIAFARTIKGTVYLFAICRIAPLHTCEAIALGARPRLPNIIIKGHAPKQSKQRAMQRHGGMFHLPPGCMQSCGMHRIIAPHQPAGCCQTRTPLTTPPPRPPSQQPPRSMPAPIVLVLQQRKSLSGQCCSVPS